MRQQTLTGLNTTHHSNETVYNPKNEETSTLTQEIIDHDQEESCPSTRRNINDYNDYKTNDYKNPSPPPVIRSYTENTNRDPLDYRLSIDCAMAIGASVTSLEDPSYPPLDSWTVFKSKAIYFVTVIKMYFIKSPRLFGTTSVIKIMGGFHILLLKLKTLYKKYILLGLQQWW